MSEDFAVFILTHGRPDSVITYQTLKRFGYTGKIYIVIDDEDATADQYRKNFGDKVIQFSKDEIAKTFDEGDNFGDRRAIIYARNACFGIAENLGVKYFLELDDDYTSFRQRYMRRGGSFARHVKQLDIIFSLMLEFYKSTICKSLAMAQGGDFFGGMNADIVRSTIRKRKCMNTFICSTDRPFQFVGRVNEDVNTYTHMGSIGYLFLTFPCIAIEQKPTQHNTGGMTEMYLDSGTYIKSFYSVMYQPSSITVNMMGRTHRRLHHHINWLGTVPQIIKEKYRVSEASNAGR